MEENIIQTAEIKPLSKLQKVLAFIGITLFYIATPAVLLFAIFSPLMFVFFLLIPLPFLPIVTELKISKKKNLSPFFFLPSAIIGYLFYIALMFLTNDSMSGYMLIIVMTVLLIIRILAATISLVKIKKEKLISLSFLGIVLAIIFSYFIVQVAYPWYEDKITQGQSDILGSWSYIKDNFARTDGWKQIVKSSDFKMGEIEYDEDMAEYFCDIASYPAIDGSTVCVPMAMEFARQHLGFSDEQSKTFAEFSTTHNAYENLINNNSSYLCFNRPGLWETVNVINNKTDIILATEPSEEELEMAEKAGVTLVKKPICYDAFVFITHKDNPVDSLTVEEIRKIYSGKIKNWEAVGGKDEKIAAFQREENSGSQTAMENLVMGGKNMMNPKKVKVVFGMGALIDSVAEYENETASIGYTYKYYIDNLYKNDEIKILSVNGVYPSDENIRNGSYPFTTNYYGVIRAGDEKKTGGLFLDWMLSGEGQRCIKQAGYITMEESE